MSDMGRGSGWWLASDGKWYPPKWEYRWFTKIAQPRAGFRGPDLNIALQESVEEAAKLGAEGWELVNFTTEWVTGEGRHVGHWTVVCILKRPVVP